jgi:hypothetical protein
MINDEAYALSHTRIKNRFNSRRLIHFTKALKDMGYKIEPLAAQKACSAC